MKTHPNIVSHVPQGMVEGVFIHTAGISGRDRVQIAAYRAGDTDEFFPMGYSRTARLCGLEKLRSIIHRSKILSIPFQYLLVRGPRRSPDHHHLDFFRITLEREDTGKGRVPNALLYTGGDLYGGALGRVEVDL